MSFPQLINPNVPQDTDIAAYGAQEIRALKQLLIDLFALPVSPTPIQKPLFTFDTLNNVYVLSNTRIGHTDTQAEGMIRWTGSDFEVYDGTKWISLTSGQAPSSLLNIKTAFAYNMFFGGTVNAY